MDDYIQVSFDENVADKIIYDNLLQDMFEFMKVLIATVDEEDEGHEEYWKEENKYNESQVSGNVGDIGLRNVGIRPGPSADFDLDAPVDDIPLEDGLTDDVTAPDVTPIGPGTDTGEQI